MVETQKKNSNDSEESDSLNSNHDSSNYINLKNIDN